MKSLVSVLPLYSTGKHQHRHTDGTNLFQMLTKLECIAIFSANGIAEEGAAHPQVEGIDPHADGEVGHGRQGCI